MQYRECLCSDRQTVHSLSHLASKPITHSAVTESRLRVFPPKPKPRRKWGSSQFWRRNRNRNLVDLYLQAWVSFWLCIASLWWLHVINCHIIILIIIMFSFQQVHPTPHYQKLLSYRAPIDLESLGILLMVGVVAVASEIGCGIVSIMVREYFWIWSGKAWEFC